MMDYRQKITEEAALMFRTYGIRAVTMDMLANRMGISKKTIYEVFRDKDELLQGVLRLMILRQKDVMNKILDESENVIEAILKMLDKMIDHLQFMSPAFQLDIRRYHNEFADKLNSGEGIPFYQDKVEIIKKGIKEGLFREDIDIDITNKCITEVLKIPYDKNVFSPDGLPDKDILRNFYVNFIRGISTPKGLDLIAFYEKKQNINEQNR